MIRFSITRKDFPQCRVAFIQRAKNKSVVILYKINRHFQAYKMNVAKNGLQYGLLVHYKLDVISQSFLITCLLFAFALTVSRV